MAKLVPVGERIVVKRLEAETMTKGGIVLPDSAKEKPAEGKIISLGGGKVLKDGTLSKFQVKKGDRVLFSSYAGTEIKFEGAELLIMSESDILAVVE
jgi:chaperonin GroES